MELSYRNVGGIYVPEKGIEAYFPEVREGELLESDEIERFDLPTHTGHGSFELVTGCMFSGKTDDANNRCRNRTEFAKEEFVRFKSPKDTRAGKDHSTYIKVHPPSDRGEIILIPAVVIEYIEDCLPYLAEHPENSFVLHDEGHFEKTRYRHGHTRVYMKLKKHGYGVIATYLDFTFEDEDFPLPGDEKTSDIARIADEVTRRKAICQKKDADGNMCRRLATRSQRFNPDGTIAGHGDPVILVGEEKHEGEEVSYYEARCEECKEEDNRLIAEL